MFGTPRKIQKQRLYNCSRERLWFYITDSQQLSEWLMPNDIKLEIGHKFTFVTKPGPGFDGVVSCQIIDFSEPSLLQYSWLGGQMQEPTTVTFELADQGAKTLLTLTHDGFGTGLSSHFTRTILNLGWGRLLKNKLGQMLAEPTTIKEPINE